MANRPETDSGVWINQFDPAFNLTRQLPEEAAADKPAVYLFSNSRNGDGPAYAMAEDGTVLGSHICSHWGYMRHDLHDQADRRLAIEAHYPGGYRLVVLIEPGSLPPQEVLDRNLALPRES